MREFQLKARIVSRLLPQRSTAALRGFTGHVAHPTRSIVSRLLPQRLTAKHSSQVVIPTLRPCRSSIFAPLRNRGSGNTEQLIPRRAVCG